MHNSTGLFTKAKADVAEFTTSLDAEKADLVEAVKSLSASVESQAASKKKKQLRPSGFRARGSREGFCGEVKSVGRVPAVS